jgi:outer membrane protein OmpA-like peptidoglycan-associated protein
MRIVLSLLVGTALATAQIAPSLAQTPSAEDIIKSLKPSGTIGSGTRGIRPATAAPADAPAPVYVAPAPVYVAPSAPAQPVQRPVAAAATPRPVAPPAPVNAPSINLEVKFATNSADLTPEARAALDRLGTALSSPDLAGFRFRIAGHTDTVGSPEANRSLSARRANTVVDYLSSNYRVDRSRLEAIGMGSDSPAYPTGPQVDEPRNRRVQVVNLGA